MAKKKPGVKFDITKLKVIQSALKKIVDKHYVVRVGIFGEKSARPQDKKQGPTNAEIGFIHEMGSASLNIPRRSFLWDTFTYHGGEMAATLKPALDALFKKGKVEEYLKLVGTAARNLVGEAFDTGGWGAWPPNAPATIEAKGSDKPLWDSGQLSQAISSRTIQAS